MISFVVRPSPSRRATYLRVRSSLLMRVNTMRQSAWLAWRLPPGLSRCRVVLPDDAGSGATPQRCAKAASLVSRWGLSPAATSKIAAVWIPNAVDLEQGRRRPVDELLEQYVKARAVGFECQHTPAQRGDGEFGRVSDDVGLRVRTQCCRGASELVSMHATKAFSQVVGGGEAEVADLVQVLDPHVATRSASDEQHPDRFHVTIGGLRDPRRTTRQRGPRRFDRRQSSRTCRHGDATGGSDDQPRSP